MSLGRNLREGILRGSHMGGPWISSHDLDKRNWPETETVLFLFLFYHRPIATSYPTVHGEGGVGAGEPQTGWI